MRAFVGRHDVTRQESLGEKTPQRAVDGRVGDLVEAGRSKPPNHVVPVTIAIGERSEDDGVEHALKELRALETG
jgi:hypothetical protein